MARKPRKTDDTVTVQYLTEAETAAWNLANELPADFRFKSLPKTFQHTCPTCGHVHTCGHKRDHKP